jgi:DNA-binding MarR family transcriptional regulator
MSSDLKSAVMSALSERLSITVSDLTKTLQVQPEELKSALKELEGKQLINLANDTITGDVLISPTSLGILQARRQSKISAF